MLAVHTKPHDLIHFPELVECVCVCTPLLCFLPYELCKQFIEEDMKQTGAMLMDSYISTGRGGGVALPILYTVQICWAGLWYLMVPLERQGLMVAAAAHIGLHWSRFHDVLSQEHETSHSERLWSGQDRHPELIPAGAVTALQICRIWWLQLKSQGSWRDPAPWPQTLCCIRTGCRMSCLIKGAKQRLTISGSNLALSVCCMIVW